MTREGIKMTNDEAKSVLFDMLGKGIYVKNTKENQAILAALRALEQKPCEDWYDVPSDEMTFEQARQAVRDLRKMWAEHLWQEPCGKDINVPTTDAIDRDELLKAMDTWDKFGYTETGCFVREPKNDCVKYIHYDDVIKCIKGMPSVTSQQKNMTREKTCKNCINAKECVMYEPNMKRCKAYKEDPKEIYNKGFADGQKALAEHLKLCKEEQGWIPVSERLPLLRGLYKISDDVLITNGFEIDMGYLVKRGGKIFWHYYGSEYEFGIKDEDNDATAWMPLPEPYKGSEAKQ